MAILCKILNVKWINKGWLVDWIIPAGNQWSTCKTNSSLPRQMWCIYSQWNEHSLHLGGVWQMLDTSLSQWGPPHWECPAEGTRMRQSLDTRQVFAIAEESMAAWYRGEKILGAGHGNCLKMDLGRRQKQPQWKKAFMSETGNSF